MNTKGTKATKVTKKANANVSGDCVTYHGIIQFAFFVTFVSFVSFVLTALTTQAQPLPYESKATSVGVVNCANSLCHGSASPWKDSHILQNEYITWSRVDKHATRAYGVLMEERSQRIARNLGLT